MGKITASTQVFIQKRFLYFLASLAILLCPVSLFAGDNKTEVQPATSGTDHTPMDLLTMQTDYTGSATVRHDSLPLGSQSVVYNDLSYGHRIHLTGQWYFRLGFEYRRYDFSGSIFPLPYQLQSIEVPIAVEYVVQGFAATCIELRPGFDFENSIGSKNFNVALNVYTAFPIKKDKLFGMVGFYADEYIDPCVYPIFGVIWLVNDKTRLEAIFPQSALVYDPFDNWEFRLTAEYNGYGFRMDNNGRLPDAYAGSVMQYYYEKVGGLVKYTGFKSFDVSLGAGLNISSEFDFFRDGPGQKYKTDNAPYVRFMVESKF